MAKVIGESTSRRVIKTLSIFGSVQVITVLCGIIRAKCIALWLGTAGVGTFGLYNTAIEMINQLVQLNIRQSGVREISKAPLLFSLYVKAVVRRLGALLGLIGALLTIVLAPILSRFTFGDTEHTLPFVFLSVVVFFNSLVSGEQAVLQAGKNFKRLASATAWGGVFGTLVSIGMIKLWGFDAIVPSVVLFSLIIAAAYYIRKPKDQKTSISAKMMFETSIPIIKLGIFMTAAMFITQLSTYIFLSWLRFDSGDDIVGLYQAGYTIINRYVGLVFTVLAVEFFPRISSVNGSKWRVSIFVRHELFMIIWGLTGVIILFINMVPIIVKLLYSSEFVGSVDYIIIASVGTLFKAVSFVMAYVILARGDGKIYLLTETISSILYIVLNVYGYKNGGMSGLGIAYVIWYATYLAIMVVVYTYRYKMHLVGQPILLTIATFAVVAAQAFLCLSERYLVATILSCIIVPFTGVIIYQFFWKRRMLKE